jgi:hypothetical protein
MFKLQQMKKVDLDLFNRLIDHFEQMNFDGSRMLVIGLHIPNPKQVEEMKREIQGTSTTMVEAWKLKREKIMKALGFDETNRLRSSTTTHNTLLSPMSRGSLHARYSEMIELEANRESLQEDSYSSVQDSNTAAVDLKKEKDVMNNGGGGGGGGDGGGVSRHSASNNTPPSLFYRADEIGTSVNPSREMSTTEMTDIKSRSAKKEKVTFQVATATESGNQTRTTTTATTTSKEVEVSDFNVIKGETSEI